MKVIIQRVQNCSVTIDGAVHSQIGKGLLILLGVAKGDTEAEAAYLAAKCTGLRIFEDAAGKMNLSAEAIGGELMVVTNFTLCGSCIKGKRPSFDGAERPEIAKPLTEFFVSECRKSGLRVETGVFGADMKVALTNDGPVTLVIDTAER